MLLLRVLLLLAVFMLPPIARPAVAEDLGIQVPKGFEVSLYADDTLAHDIFSMTIDARGRIVVAGAGYVKILHDSDADGRADRATLYSSVPASGAHGMVFDGPDLVCTGDNSIMRLRDTDGDGVADGEPETWTQLRHPEHGANGLVRGPDGCFYLICGNDAGVTPRQITAARSPVAQPRSGAIVRFSPEGKPLDVFAHGFRNPYDLDFDAAGHILTVDSDGERDHHLPWYAPTRLFDVAQGREHGWLLIGWARGWNRPPYFFDSVERMVEIGRGSPTGVVAYRHRAFPEHYRGGVFAACWTFGRVYYFPLKTAGASCSSQLEPFVQTTGDVGFAPCDLAVGPDGDLFVAIGGRRTRGSVFRVHATGSPPEPVSGGALAQVLSADQPLASWSRARWTPLARELGPTAFAEAALNSSLDNSQRVRAIEILVEVFGTVDAHFAERIADSAEPAVKARLAWALSRVLPSEAAQKILARMTGESDPRVQRAAWEALATLEQIDASASPPPAWRTGLQSPARRVRAAAIAVAQGAGQASYRNFVAHSTADQKPSAALRLADLWVQHPEVADAKSRRIFTPAEFQTSLECLASAGENAEQTLEAIRLLQIGLGDVRTQEGQAEVYSGYACNLIADLGAARHDALVRQLAPRFPHANADVNRELARLLGMLGANDARLLEALTRLWTQSSSVEDDIHYLIVASLLAGPREHATTERTARALLRLHEKLDQAGQFASRNWPLRLGEALDQLCRRDSALPSAIANSPHLGHEDHTVFAIQLPREARELATRRLWSITTGAGEEPTADLIALVGRLPAEEARPLLLSQWEHPGLHDPIVLALAKSPRAGDRGKFLEALASPQTAVVEKAAGALVALGIDCTPSELAAALRSYKAACSLPKKSEPRGALVRLLEFWTEGSADIDDTPDPADAYLPWYEMFAQLYPHEASELRQTSGLGAEGWQARLKKVDWSAGQPTRGRGVFELRACHRCHQASGHLGPELKGSVSRLSREDLFTAIFDPNLEVSPAYQTTVVATNDGQVYHGLVVYESPESTLLQTGPDTTVRVTSTEQSSMHKSNRSLMPTGLLDTLSDQDLSDLYAYLKTLAAR